MKIKNPLMICRYIALLLVIATFTQSCRKSAVENDPQIGNVQVRLLGVASEVHGLGNGKRASTFNQPQQTAVQERVIPFAGGKVVATLSPENAEKSNIKTSHSARNGATRAASTVERLPLANTARYRVLVYNMDGTLVEAKTFVRGSEADAGPFTLDGGQTYTFVAVSLGLPLAIPAITGEENLNTATLTNVTRPQLMYFQKTMEVKGGEETNFLDIVLTHKFSRITTTVSVDDASAARGARVIRVEDAFFRPTHQSADIKLIDGSLTYGEPTPNGTEIGFTGLHPDGQISWEGQEAYIRAPEILDAATLEIGSLTVTSGNDPVEITDGITIDDLDIIPGHRYNLNLTITPPCTEIVGSAQDFGSNYPNPLPPDGQTVQTTHTFGAADYGFIFDVYQLDNSFNMNINGVDLATNEIQFESGISGYPVNVEFATGHSYGQGTIPEIFSLTGMRDPNRPILRVVIAADGTVSMFGTRTSATSTSWRLEPLRLRDGTTFNTVPWNSTGTNTVTSRQVVASLTTIQGNGRGYRKIDCAN